MPTRGVALHPAVDLGPKREGPSTVMGVGEMLVGVHVAVGIQANGEQRVPVAGLGPVRGSPGTWNPRVQQSVMVRYSLLKRVRPKGRRFSRKYAVYRFRAAASSSRSGKTKRGKISGTPSSRSAGGSGMKGGPSCAAGTASGEATMARRTRVIPIRSERTLAAACGGTTRFLSW